MQKRILSFFLFLFLFLNFSDTLFAQFYYDESCKDTSGIFKPIGPCAGYTANMAGIGDVPGNGWLRLTKDSLYHEGYVIVKGKYPSDLGLTVEFDFKVFTDYVLATIADGFSVFLFDGKIKDSDFRIGSKGGALGYLNNTNAGTPGLKGGYLAVGIDEFGSFQRYSTGDYSYSAGNMMSHVITLVGSEAKNFPLVTNTAKNFSGIPNLSGTLLSYNVKTAKRPSDDTYFRRLRLEIEKEGTGMRVKVFLKKTVNGVFYPVFSTLVNSTKLAPLPDSLRVGFAASTGNWTAIHEVRNVVIKTPGNLAVYKDIPECAGHDGFPITTIISNALQSPANGVEVKDTLPAEFEIFNFEGGNFVSGGEPVLRILGDGRQEYTYKVNVLAETDMKIQWNGRLSSYPPGGLILGGASISVPSGFADNNYTDNVAHHEVPYSGLINQTPIVSFVTKEESVLLKVASNETGVSYHWSMKKSPLDAWIPISAVTTNQYVFPGSDFANTDNYYIRCQGNWGSGCNDSVIFVITRLPDNINDSASCITDPPEGVWSIRERYRSTEGVFEMSVPLVGDIDHDGLVEIVCAGSSIQNNLFSVKNMMVFDAVNKRLKTTFPVENFHGGFGNIAMADVDGDGFAEIFVATDEYATLGNRGYLYCYSHNGTFKWKSNFPYTTDVARRTFTYLKITDFNGDGIPDIMANDRIFNTLNGQLLLDCKLIDRGLDYGTGAGHGSYYGTQTGSLGNFSAAGDIDGDGLPELIAGRNIYKIKINSLTDASKNSCAILRTVNYGSRTDIGDGYTSLADLDLDGTLDVIVTRMNPVSKSTKYMYAWSGKTGELLHTNVVSVNDGVSAYGGSIPFVGDLDGDGVPEVSFSGANRLYAFKYNKNTRTFAPMSWSPLITTDESGSTTLTLFDFDLDKKMELVYRDESTIRILDGTTAAVKASKLCKSWTMNEYPVIADVMGNGHANIIVMGEPEGVLNGNGYLYIFESDPDFPGATPWAPARKVWNQWPYNVLNVNEDLTIPTVLMNPAKEFPGKEGVKVRPYNAFLQQATSLNISGTPLFLLANAQTVGKPHFYYDPVIDSLTVSVKVYNAGDIGFQNPFWVTAYKNAVGNTVKTSFRYEKEINKKDTALITFGISKFKQDWVVPSPNFSGIVIRLNDKGNGYADQLVCDSSARDYTTGPVIAVDDHVLVFTNTLNNKIPVTQNDIYPLSCIQPSVSIWKQPISGSSASVTSGDTLITYTPKVNYIGLDSLEYILNCNGLRDTAIVYFNVLPIPDNISDADCVIDPKAQDWTFRAKYISSESNLSPYFSPIVGDITGDSIPEIIAAYSLGSDQYNTDKLRIFKGGNLDSLWTMNIKSTNIGSLGVMAMAKVEGIPMLFVWVSSELKINAYNLLTGAWVWSSASTIGDNILTSAVVPSIADFDNDGIPEVYAGSKIFDARNGKLLWSGGGNEGKMNLTDFNIISNSILSFAANVIGDERLELLAGNQLYDVVIDRANPRLNVLPFRSVRPPVFFNPAWTVPADGLTQVADINNDGQLDIIVSRHDYKGNQSVIYVWDPSTEQIMASRHLKSSENAGFMNYPFVGDIDSCGRPEILAVYELATNSTSLGGNMQAFKYIDGNTTLQDKWTNPYPIQESYARTGITLFDFNQDGRNEIVYRDMKLLRIIDGSGTTPSNKATYTCLSGTGHEYPVVADVDNDGQAEIVVIGGKTTTDQGYLSVFSSVTGNPWAPARLVWNQYAYNAVNINEDLTVPKYQMSPATVFPGKDGILGTSNDVRPYNGFLMQQTLLNKNGNYLFLAPNAQTVGKPVFSYDPINDSMTVSIQVYNAGSAALQDPFKVTAYKNEVGNNPKQTYSYKHEIMKGDTVLIMFGIPKFKQDWMIPSPEFKGIAIRINDKGDGFVDQPVCDSSSRDYLSGSIIAVDDHLLVFGNSLENKLPVILNDIYPLSCTLPEVSLYKQPMPGANATVVSGGISITYTPKSNYIGLDSLEYILNCNGLRDTAKVYMTIVPKPDNINDSVDCWAEPEGRPWNIKEERDLEEVNTISQILAGDMDGDEYPEIVAFSKDAKALKIFKGPDFNMVTTIPITNPITVQYYYSAMAMAKVKTTEKPDGQPLLFLITQGSPYAISAYKPEGGAVLWTANCSSRGMIGVADFNNDGWSEVYIGNQIFDAATGIKICDGLTNNKGETVGIAAAVSHSIAVDIIGDQNLELVAGSQIYKITINRINDATISGSMTVSTFVTPPVPGAKDGFTSVADFTNDGKLEVLVRTRDGVSDKIYLYLWTPHTVSPKILAQKVDVSKFFGIPFIGDIDGKKDAAGRKHPEISYLNANGLVGNQPKSFLALNYNGSSDPTTAFTQLWAIDHTDQSGATGMTLFDFNQDGISEIVYRDEDSLRIINGSLKSHISGKDTNKVYTLASFKAYSETAYEYPLIVDLYNSGSSQILVTSDNKKVRPFDGFGKLKIFSSNTPGAWASARPVWNQYAYNVVNVNKDLTIPKYQMSPATFFPGKDGQLGTSDDIQPYNAFRQQATVLDKFGLPLWLTAFPGIAYTPDFYYDPVTDSLTIRVPVYNIGEASLHDSVKVTVYRNELGNSKKYTYGYPYRINVGDTTLITFGIPKFKQDWVNISPTFKGLLIRINDNGNGYADQPVCDSSDRDYFSHEVILSDDRIPVFACGKKVLDIMQNDIYPSGATLHRVKTGKGLVTFELNTIIYEAVGRGNCCDWAGNIDTVVYSVCNRAGDYCDTAIVLIDWLFCPDIILVDSCSPSPRMIIKHQYQSAQYIWQYLDENSNWITLTQYTGPECTEVKPGKYRVQITYAGMQTTTPERKLIEEKTFFVAGKKWYQLTLE